MIFQPGNTTFTRIGFGSAGFPPPGYLLATQNVHFNVTTSAIFSSPVTVCLVAFGIDDPEDFVRLRVLHREGGQLVDRTIHYPSTPGPIFAVRQVCGRADEGGDFYLAYGPSFSVAGRILTPTGNGLRNTTVILTDYRGIRQTTTSSSFGTFSFPNARFGETYTISVGSKRYRFGARTIVIGGNITDADMIGLE